MLTFERMSACLALFFLALPFCLIGCGLGETGPRVHRFGVPEDTRISGVVLDEVWSRCREREFQGDSIPRLTGKLAQMDYDQYRKIIFDPDKQFWKSEDIGWILDLFHAGYIYQEPVRIHFVKDAAAEGGPVIEEIKYDPELFWFLDDVVVPEDIPDPFGYAGLRLHTRFGDPERSYSESMTFLGASYFRGIGDEHIYGSSARGLAIDTGVEGKIEEFPIFREFWIEKPKAGSDECTVWAYLDSKSIHGIFRMDINPSKSTDIHVQAKMQARHDITKLCFAPITSMYMWGDGKPAPAGDHRPEVHDADGLLCHSTTGEWLWRPLREPEKTETSQEHFPGLTGFGLLQRDLNYDSYKDDEALYHKRPSIWIEPTTPLPAGRVEVLEIDSPGEWIDNIAAFWVPDETIKAGDYVELDYLLSFCTGDPPEHKGGKVIRSEVIFENEDSVRCLLTFAGEGIRNLPTDSSLRLQLDTSDELVGTPYLTRRSDGTVLAEFLLKYDSKTLGWARASLVAGNDFLSETWSYRCRP
ncbi:glucan biosynthesis protein [Calycomorphotria hydatis]|uniref:Glucans biosynthesis protein G n=1 Tax=Calycomorphotria hydatis TaxID=2528027 RepID=A0A517T7V4_9PLAN|nr:glucan biosynthesis protein [Calycomorphotria hydatis]QDT64454.1 Glucans biosynthesis protein G precursor [Calycomorphotria hydatis]